MRGTQVQFEITGDFTSGNQKGLWLALLHADRVPPHIGLVFNDEFFSLTVKGHDLNVPVEVLLKNLKQRRISACFIRVVDHPYFSMDYLKEHFITNIQKFERVDIGMATCLSPIRSFFHELYGIDPEGINLLTDLLAALSKNSFIDRKIKGINLPFTSYSLPSYNSEDITEGIKKVRAEYNTA